jgi:hypothetical protein
MAAAIVTLCKPSALLVAMVSATGYSKGTGAESSTTY